MNKIKAFTLIYLIVSTLALTLPSAYAYEPSVICERLKLTSIASSGESIGCKAAEADWMFGVDIDQHQMIPTVISADRPSKAKILILSSTWSSAYDVSSRIIIGEFRSRGLGVEFILLNYQGDIVRAKKAIDVAESMGIDLIVSMGTATTDFITDYYAGGRLPVVTSCSEDPISMNWVNSTINMSLNNIAYTSTRIGVDTQVAYLKDKFLTKLRYIAIIYDGNNPNFINTQVKPLERYLVNSDVDIELNMIEVDFDRLDETLYGPMQRFNRFPPRIDERIFLVTGSSNLFSMIENINYYANGIPVLSMTPSHVIANSLSVFMAIGVSVKSNAKLAADYAYRIITRQSLPETMPVGIVSTPDIAINFQRKPPGNLKVPFNYFEDAFVIFNHDGVAVRGAVK
ncbi:hypothetical protein A9Q99_22535 [Gammaproteobacteria bacterium 45_16_T64]|nr:hypothetical protein A9Q99_22535 [Gammaproteobacteria bacterium 45_16_T64]